MRVEPLQANHPIKAVLSHFVTEMQRAGYAASWARGLAGSVRAGRLAAFVALADGRPVGLLAWKREGGRAILPLLTVAQEEDPRLVAGALLAAALPALQAGGAKHAFHQLRQIDEEPYRQAFLAAGFDELRVEKMARARGALPEPPRAPAGYTLHPWQPGDLGAAAQLFLRLPRDPLESIVWPELCTLEGACSLFDALMQGQGHAAWALTADAAPALAGYILARRLRSGEGYIGEVGVAPEQQGRGLGRVLVSAALVALADAPAVWLTVSSSNVSAIRLYRSLGFETTQTQSVFVWRAPSTTAAAPFVAESDPITQE